MPLLKLGLLLSGLLLHKLGLPFLSGSPFEKSLLSVELGLPLLKLGLLLLGSLLLLKLGLLLLGGLLLHKLGLLILKGILLFAVTRIHALRRSKNYVC